MSAPNPETVIRTLGEAVEFCRRVGANTESKEIEKQLGYLQENKPTFKVLRGPVSRATDEGFLKVRQILCDDGLDPRPGNEKLVEEYERIWGAITDIYYPREPELPRLDISNFKGSELVENKSVAYVGDPAAVREVIERSIELISNHTKELGVGSFSAAYSTTSVGLQSWMSLKKFIKAHNDASQEFGGPPLEFRIKSFACVLGDSASRLKSKSDEGWPKKTEKADRRATLTGFWIRERKKETGCWGSFWISEELGSYRIAKFGFFTM